MKFFSFGGQEPFGKKPTAKPTSNPFVLSQTSFDSALDSTFPNQGFRPTIPRKVAVRGGAGIAVTDRAVLERALLSRDPAAQSRVFSSLRELLSGDSHGGTGSKVVTDLGVVPVLTRCASLAEEVLRETIREIVQRSGPSILAFSFAAEYLAVSGSDGSSGTAAFRFGWLKHEVNRGLNQLRTRGDELSLGDPTHETDFPHEKLMTAAADMALNRAPTKSRWDEIGLLLVDEAKQKNRIRQAAALTLAATAYVHERECGRDRADTVEKIFSSVVARARNVPPLWAESLLSHVDMRGLEADDLMALSIQCPELQQELVSLVLSRAVTGDTDRSRTQGLLALEGALSTLAGDSRRLRSAVREDLAVQLLMLLDEKVWIHEGTRFRLLVLYLRAEPSALRRCEFLKQTIASTSNGFTDQERCSLVQQFALQLREQAYLLDRSQNFLGERSPEVDSPRSRSVHVESLRRGVDFLYGVALNDHRYPWFLSATGSERDWRREHLIPTLAPLVGVAEISHNVRRLLKILDED